MNQKNDVCKCNIREEESFYDWDDFYKFVEQLNNTSTFQSIPVERYLYNVGEEENWYKCNECEKIYRLVKPDPPYAGQWQPVDEEEILKK